MTEWSSIVDALFVAFPKLQCESMGIGDAQVSIFVVIQFVVNLDFCESILAVLSLCASDSSYVLSSLKSKLHLSECRNVVHNITNCRGVVYNIATLRQIMLQ